ncbi:molybdate ABC transporter substrate-binding protein [Actinomyces oricola]
MLTRQRRLLAAIALVPLFSLAACSGTSSTSGSSTAEAGSSASAAGPVSGELTVFAAASLQGAFEEIAQGVKEDNPDLTITFNFLGSQDLVTALANGDAADVLATANNSTMTDAANQSLVGEQTEFATNTLTLIVPKGNPAGITGLDSSLDGADLVICAPEVPCGEATEKLATALGVTLNPVSEEQKVTDVRGKVESGEADAGIVYTTDAAAATGVEEISIPNGGVINHYPIAITSGAQNTAAAQAFIDYILSDKGRAILDTHGFGAPGAGATASATASPTGQ